ncbi:MAG: GNAT family N-acetyltransferase [Dongiaceae bacterium]
MSLLTITPNGLTPDIDDRIDEGFAAHAKAAGIERRRFRFDFVARQDARFAGIIEGKIFFGMLLINTLFIEEDFRNKGLGKKLLEQALDYGRGQGCRFATVTTFDFQAPEFYQKNGFIIQFIDENYGPGRKFFSMQRPL